MTDRAAELNPLAPSALEVGIAAFSMVHVVLVALVIVQLLRGKLTLGVFGLIVLLFVPVLGPVFVLTWRGRVERHQARTQRAVA